MLLLPAHRVTDEPHDAASAFIYLAYVALVNKSGASRIKNGCLQVKTTVLFAQCGVEDLAKAMTAAGERVPVSNFDHRTIY